MTKKSPREEGKYGFSASSILVAKEKQGYMKISPIYRKLVWNKTVICTELRITK